MQEWIALVLPKVQHCKELEVDLTQQNVISVAF